MIPALTAFFDRATRTPFAYGAFDCLLYPADWLVAAGHPDPAAAWRGRYRTQLGAERLIRRAGGLVALAQAGMAQHRRADAPLIGDVGIVSCLTAKGARPLGAVFNGRLWVTLGAGGLVSAAFPPLAVWRTPCLKP